MKKASKFIYYIPILLTPVLYYLDRLSKTWAVENLKGKEDIVLIKNVLRFSYLENRGAAFGILQDSRILFIILTLFITVFAVGAYIYLCVRGQMTLPLMLIFAMLMAGAFGNFADRFMQAFVIDFIYFNLINFPIFNVADIYITCGCILIAIYLIRSDKKV